MKKLFFICMLILPVAFCYSQKTVTLPIEKAKEVLIAAKQDSICEAQLDSLSSQIHSLQIEKTRLENVVRNDMQRDSLSTAQLAVVNDQLKQTQSKFDTMSAYAKILDKDLTKAKRGKRWFAIGGIVLAVIASILTKNL
jgi:conjugal transfer/entry exclusion protein